MEDKGELQMYDVATTQPQHFFHNAKDDFRNLGLWSLGQISPDFSNHIVSRSSRYLPAKGNLPSAESHGFWHIAVLPTFL